jgi:hypothetical protein
MHRVILLGYILGLSGCSYTTPVVVNDEKNILIGTTTASLSGGHFEVSDNEVICSGTYDSLDSSPTIKAQTSCSDGRTGQVIARRDSSITSGSGIVKMDDGKTAKFLFGQPAIQFIEARKDENQCKSYGFKKGTKDFSNCMMKLLQTRQVQVQASILEAEREKKREEEQNQQILDSNACRYADENFDDCMQKKRYYRANPSAPPIYAPPSSTPAPQPVYTYQPPPTPIQNREIRCTTKKDYWEERLGRDVILTECN